MTTTTEPDRTGGKTVHALNEVGRRIRAFARTTHNPAAQQAYRNALQIITEVRDSEQGGK